MLLLFWPTWKWKHLNALTRFKIYSSFQQISGFTNELHAKAEYHKFLIGRGGVNIRRVREKTGARIIFPSDQDPEDVITIIGKKESVEQAKAELEGLIKNLVCRNVLQLSIDFSTYMRLKFHCHSTVFLEFTDIWSCRYFNRIFKIDETCVILLELEG